MFILPKYKTLHEYKEYEVKFIKDNRRKLNDNDIAKILGRSIYSVRKKANQLGVLKNKRFTEKEIEFIRVNSESLTGKEIGKKLGRTKLSIFDKAFKLKISLKKYSENSNKHKLSDEDVKLIRILRNEEKMTLISIAKKFDCHYSTISRISHYKSRMYNKGMINIE